MTTKREKEPSGAAGSEAAGRKVLMVRLGRGRTGGSTVMDWIVQRARRGGRPIIVADGDLKNPTMSSWYAPGTPGGAVQPPSDYLGDMKDWLRSQISGMIRAESSLALDMGGGDRVLSDVARSFSLIEFCESVGVTPLGLYFTGPDVNDFEHVLSIFRSGHFRPRRSVVFLNEGLVRDGKSPQGAFDSFINSKGAEELDAAGTRFVVLPHLECMDEMRSQGLSFYGAAESEPGNDGIPFDPLLSFMVGSWMDKLEQNLSKTGALGWLP